LWPRTIHRAQQKNRALARFFGLPYLRFLRTLYLSAAQATGTHVKAARRSFHQNADALGVGLPHAAGFAVGVAHRVAGHGALGANRTGLAHRRYTSFGSGYTIKADIVYQQAGEMASFFYEYKHSFATSKFPK